MIIDETTKEVEALAEDLAKNLLGKQLKKAIEINRLAGSIKSPSFDGMPKGTPNGNASEIMMVKISDCRQLIRQVSETLTKFDTDEFIALQEHYLHDKSAIAIARKLMVSRATVYRLIDKGLLEFVYTYNQGELLNKAAEQLASNKQLA